MLCNARIAERRSYELAASVRLVAAAESARECKYLRLLQRLDDCFRRLLYILGTLIFYYQNICLRAGSFKCSCRIVFAVGAREYRYENSRLSYAPWSLVDLPCAANEIFYFSACSRRRREHLFQRTLECRSRVVHFELLTAQIGGIRAVEHSDFLHVKSVKVADVVGKYHKVAERRRKHIRRYIVPSGAELIAHTRLEYACYHAALFNDVASLYFALCHSFAHSLI